MKPIPMSKWGKDHWSAFGYAETCAVDSKGVLDKERMRCNPKIHPAQANQCNMPGFPDAEKESPTRLKGWTKELPNKNIARQHDDWSCLEDAEEAGLLKVEGTGMYPVIRFTTLGQSVAGRLREHKAKGGSFSNFGATT